MEVRKMWHRYAFERGPIAHKAYENARRDEIRKTAAESLDPNPELVSNSTYYAGPHSEKATKLMNNALHGFWKHGVAGGNRSDINALKSDKDGVTNPLMMVTSASEVFGVRQTSDPLTAYHLAQVVCSQPHFSLRRSIHASNPEHFETSVLFSYLGTAMMYKS